MKSSPFVLLIFAILLMTSQSKSSLAADLRAVNYDEAQVPAYLLPDPLVLADGQPVSSAKVWQKKRRPELLELFWSQMYGRSPERPRGMKFEVMSEDKKALGGKATRKEVAVYFTGKRDGPKMTILLYLPNEAKKPVPAFLGINFDGNHTVCSDPGITIAEQWTWDVKKKQDALVRPSEDSRGNKNAGIWAVEMILARGYALATISRAEMEPDYVEGWKHGIRGYYLQKAGKTEFAPDDWGGISAWAWGLSRALDYLETDRAVDARHVAVFGHSRMGKTALWAGAQDERFALVISNNSGEGGAALARRCFGETTAIINKNFPHWFCGNFQQYNDHEEKLPMDQHEVIALIAPRPVYVASAEEDRWADPRGEFLAAKNADPVYRLLGKKGLGVEEMPAIHQPVGDTLGYHIRTGKHDVTDYDWEQYLHFTDRHFQSR